MSYPSEYKEIISNLLDGKILLYPDSAFMTVQNNDEEYKQFSQKSFGYELIIESEFVYLTSCEVNEKKLGILHCFRQYYAENLIAAEKISGRLLKGLFLKLMNL